MTHLHSVWALFGVMAFAGAVGAAHADAAAATASSSVTQELPVSTAPSACDGVSPDEARRLAREAHREGAHRRAAECFRIAGDHLRADRSLIRATADESAVASRKAVATVETAKMQARRVREAFR